MKTMVSRMNMLFLAVSLLMYIPSVTEAKELVIVVGSVNYPPYYMYEDGKYRGISLEVAQIIAERLGYTLQFRLVPFARAVQELKMRDADMIANFFSTPERAKFVEFTTEPHTNEALHFITKKGESLPYHGKAEDLKGMKIGVVRGYSNGMYIDANPEAFALDYSTNEILQIKKLLGGRHPVAVGTKSVILYHAKKLGVADEIEFLEPPLSDSPVFMGFSKSRADAKELAQRFTMEIKSFKRTKLYHELLNKYGLDIPTQ